MFYGCKRLSIVKFPTSLKKISALAFGECSSLKQIDFSNIRKNIDIYPGAFKYCSQLTNVVFSNNVSYIADTAFSGCTNLKNISNIYDTLPDIKSQKTIEKANRNLKKMVIE